MLKKRFSFLGVGWLHLFMGVLLMGVLGASTGHAQTPTIDTIGTQAKMVVRLANKAVQDSVVMPTFKIAVYDTLADTTQFDSVAIAFATGYFNFAKAGPYPVSVQGSLRADSARVNATGDTLYIKISGPVSNNNPDTLTISGVYVRAVHTNPVYNDSTTTDSLKFALVNGSNSIPSQHNGTSFVLLPAPIYSFYTISKPLSPDTAGSATISDTLSFHDKFGNAPNDTSTTVNVAAVLAGTLTPGNGTLSTGTLTKSVTLGHPGTDIYVWRNMSYTKAENINLLFSIPSSGADTTSDTIRVVAGSPANIAVTLVSGSDTLTVDQTTQYKATVTDQYFNPVPSAVITISEKTNHGGTFTPSPDTTNGNGQITVTFAPSKFYVGPDTLQFSYNNQVLQSRPIVINPGAIGGFIVDFSGSASGTQTNDNDSAAAGTTVYARAFLTDTYGNPINATSPSQVTFAISGVMGKNTSLGTPALTSAVTETKYPNTNKTAIGIAVPYTVSTNVRGAADSILVSMGAITKTLTINNRSNVPARVKMVQTSGTGILDSSLVASNYSNTIQFTDSLWDVYGNRVTAPSPSVKLAPTRSSYAMLFSTLGNVKFLRAADTTTADTLYPNNGYVSTNNIASYKVAGVDTLKSWAAANASVAVSAPIWVTPANVASVAIYPAGYAKTATLDSTAIAGKLETLYAEQFDAFGNHVDWGLSGGQTRSNYKSGFATRIGLRADTVSTGKNRGGKVDTTSLKVVNFSGATPTSADTGVASVNGKLVATFGFIPYIFTPDTQKVYVADTVFTAHMGVSGVFFDTLTIRSIKTGSLAYFKAVISPSDSVHNVGDSVLVTVTAYDSAGNRIYTYAQSGDTLILNNTSVTPIATKDTTYYFTYIRNHNGTNTAGDTIRSTGLSITSDTVFSQGQAKFWIHKFIAEIAPNTVTFKAAGLSATTSQGVLFKPLPATGPGPGSRWAINIADTLNPSGTFSFTVVPRDTFYNVDSVKTYIVNISSNQTSGFNIGSNPKVVKGPTTFSGTLSGASGSLVIYVFDNMNSATYAQKSVALLGQQFKKGDVSGNGSVTAFDASLILQYIVGDTTLTAAQLTAADVSGDGTVSAYDASLILRYVAGDTTVHFAITKKEGKSHDLTVTSVVSSGMVALNAGEVSTSGVGVMSLPVYINDAQNVYSIEMTLNVGNAQVQGVVGSLPKDWVLAYHNADGVLKIAMAGVTPLSSGKFVSVEFKGGPNTKINVSGSAIVNENPAQALASVSVADIPSKFDLGQNYPNPFNPTTTIKYQLANQANVTLRIYSITGQLIRTIVDGVQQQPGYYSVIWDGLNNSGQQVASGVYIYRLEAGSFVSMKKMLLLK
jgi:hypothetical protein